MATLQENFFADAYTFTVHGPAQFRSPLGDVEIIQRTHLDFVAGARYVSYFVPLAPDAVDCCRLLLRDPELALRAYKASAEMSMGHQVHQYNKTRG